MIHSDVSHTYAKDFSTVPYGYQIQWLLQLSWTFQNKLLGTVSVSLVFRLSSNDYREQLVKTKEEKKGVHNHSTSLAMINLSRAF